MEKKAPTPRETDSQKFVSDVEAISAIGSLEKLPVEEKIFLTEHLKTSTVLHAPSRGDWLAEHQESGQTFEDYKTHMPKVQLDKNQKYIYIVPLEGAINFTHQLKVISLAFFHGMGVKVQQHADLAQWQIPERMNMGVKQYHASKILERLKQTKPADAHCVIGVLMTDIYPREQWNFVFGLASLKEGVGVFSFARYMDTFYDARARVDRDKVIYRSAKVMCHELCHQFGIKHCIHFECLMNGSNHGEESNRKPFQLCPVCVRKLHESLQFNYVDRYRALADACRELEGEYFAAEEAIFLQTVAAVEEQVAKMAPKTNNKTENQADVHPQK